MIKILCVGKIKEKYLEQAISEYEKRLSKYIKLEIIEVPDSGESDIDKVLVTEKERLEKYIQDKDYIITLAIEGKQIDSIEFSKKIEEIQIHHANITFIIGGSYGIHEELKKKSQLQLSFSKLTFPHQLFRVLLLEQIYRAFRIQKNESYHK